MEGQLEGIDRRAVSGWFLFAVADGIMRGYTCGVNERH